MMDIGGDNPVTLVVKAPNQRIADQTIDCFLEWTVRKLKEHLENVYPSKPKHNQQKLIYSGRLLQDHFTLKEVLRQFDEATQHTLHLVCANGSDALYECPSSDTRSDSAPQSSSSSSHSVSSSSSSDGLRYRGPVMPGMEHYQYGVNPMMSPPPMGPPGYSYSPEQYLMMQQMYAQYMSQYMQYYNNAYQTPQTEVTPTAQEAGPANQIPRNNAAGAANPNMRMNAQGGMVEDDDEEDAENRDWLDYIYVMFRFLVLVSIVYFYSTISRFVAVFTGFFIIYLLQKGWLNIRRHPDRNRREPEQPEAAAAAAAQNQQPEQQQPETEQQDAEQAAANTDANTEGEATPDAAPQQTVPAEEPKPGFFAVVWCFCSTFLTSLVPQQPPAVNAN